MRILLLEPDRILGRVYGDALTQYGHKVNWVTTAQSALTVADENKPDIVVLEMQLAQHSGAAFLYEFRTYADWLKIPIVVHTLIPPLKLKGFAGTFDELGITECLYKPHTSLKRLIETVESHATVKA